MDLLDKITIYDTDNKTCTFCGCPYPHSIVNVGDEEDERRGMSSHKEFKTAHGTCRNLASQKKKLEQDLLNLEWKIFQYKTRMMQKTER